MLLENTGRPHREVSKQTLHVILSEKKIVGMWQNEMDLFSVKNKPFHTLLAVKDGPQFSCQKEHIGLQICSTLS